jgi:hypothetical protein
MLETFVITSGHDLNDLCFFFFFYYYYLIFTSTNDFVSRLLENVKAHYQCMMSSGDVSVLSFSSRTNALSRTTFHTMQVKKSAGFSRL